MTLLQRCSCGKQLDAYGDHVLSCMQFIEKKKPGHDLVEGVVMSLARSAGHNVSHDSHPVLTVAIAPIPPIGVPI